MVDLLKTIQDLEKKYKSIISPGSDVCYEFKFDSSKIYVPFYPNYVGTCVVEKIPRYCQLKSGLLIPLKLATSLKLEYRFPAQREVSIWQADDLEQVIDLSK